MADVEEVELPANKADCRHAWHLYTLRLNLDRLAIGRDEFIEQLKERGVGTSVHFIPIPLHPFFAARAKLRQNRCPNALDLYPRLISLPLFPAMNGGPGRARGEAIRADRRGNRAKRIGQLWPRRATDSYFDTSEQEMVDY